MPQVNNLNERYVEQNREKHKNVIIHSSTTLVPSFATAIPTPAPIPITQSPSILALHHLQLLLPPFPPETHSVSQQHLQSTLQPIVRTQRTTSAHSKHSNHKKKGRRRGGGKNRRQRRVRYNYTPELRTWSDRIPKHISSSTFRDRSDDELLESANNVAFAISLRTSTKYSNNTNQNAIENLNKIKTNINRGHIKFQSNQTIEPKLNFTIGHVTVVTESSVVTTIKEISSNHNFTITTEKNSSIDNRNANKNSIDYNHSHQDSNSLEIIDMDE